MSEASHSRRTIDENTRARQLQASDPGINVFVSASAGSGKTYVLVQRVIRILLQGTAPGRILCLTYTKAAAANMAERVHAMLAKWTLLDDAALIGELRNMAVDAPAQSLVQARRLFARAIETPGGLKLQTIHAFCERILHLFPFESNTPAGFRVMDDNESAVLMGAARSEVLTASFHDNERLGKAVRVLAEAGDSETFDNWLRAAQKYRGAMAAQALDAEGTALRRALGLGPHDTIEAVQDEILAGPLGPATWLGLAGLLEQGRQTDVGRAGHIRDALRYFEEKRKPQAINAWLRVFFTDKGEGTPQKLLLTKDLDRAHPDLRRKFEGEQERLRDLRERLRGLRHVQLAEALAIVAENMFARYEARKRAQGLLDFADLIARVRALLQRADAAWVLYKLDAGIDHILIDEAQDTAPEQWDILCQLAEDLTTGASANTRARSLFAVADPKQSIYSFQGAAPRRFGQMAGHFAREFANSGRAFENIGLHLSMRSSGQVLQAVEAVFKCHPRGLATEQEPFPAHEPARRSLPGYVEITESFPHLQDQTDDDWTLPQGKVERAEPVERLARHVASTIAALLAPDSRDQVHDSQTGAPRKVRADDILVLVRQRNKVFSGVITALKEAGVPVAGADRLRLNNQIAVRDLMALGRVLLLGEDDLSLAAVMKSPLLGLDDNDLIALAPARKSSLWAALAASEAPDHQRAATQLARWRAKARALTPFQFYGDVLMADGARRAFNRRLGAESLDAIDEFLRLALEHETRSAPSLSAFLTEIEAADIEIKRDMEATGAMVRVMTVHGAKGLEAKIVFLPDTCGRLRNGKPEPLVDLAQGDDAEPGARPPPAILAINKGWKHSLAQDAENRQNDSATQEHARLLYVAMTRAEERLYISGHDPKGRSRPAGCWYNMLLSSLEKDAAVEMPDQASAQQGHKIWRLGKPLQAPVEGEATKPSPPAPAPGWMHRPAPAEAAPLPPISPSQTLAAAEPLAPASDAMAMRSLLALERGRALHVLLQHLPLAAVADRPAVAQRLLAYGRPEWPRDQWISEAGRVLALDEMQALFSGTARAEVAIAGRLTDRQGRTRDIVGQIDLLAVTGQAIDIADYKTGKVPEPAAVPAAHMRQLALYCAVVGRIYPGRQVRAHLIYTAGPSCITLTPLELAQALSEALDGPG
ncbi:MAG: double-strand break repair helicase AddA [Hyphomicrobiales bacterium]|nr:double-strand break repair helicase AddA [Hyphomicrobiales bacterium]